MNSDIDNLIQIGIATGIANWSAAAYEHDITSIEYIALGCENDQGTLVGFVIGRADPVEAELLNIAVVNSFQRSGIGQLLLDELIRELKTYEAKVLYLEVRKSNISAASFYAKNGFGQVGIRKNYYSNPTEDALILKKSI